MAVVKITIFTKAAIFFFFCFVLMFVRQNQGCRQSGVNIIIQALYFGGGGVTTGTPTRFQSEKV